MFFFLASTDLLITLKAVIASGSIPASDAAIFFIAASSAAAAGLRLICICFPISIQNEMQESKSAI